MCEISETKTKLMDFGMSETEGKIIEGKMNLQKKMLAELSRINLHPFVKRVPLTQFDLKQSEPCQRLFSFYPNIEDAFAH